MGEVPFKAPPWKVGGIGRIPGYVPTRVFIGETADPVLVILVRCWETSENVALLGLRPVVALDTDLSALCISSGESG